MKNGVTLERLTQKRPNEKKPYPARRYREFSHYTARRYYEGTFDPSAYTARRKPSRETITSSDSNGNELRSHKIIT